MSNIGSIGKPNTVIVRADSLVNSWTGVSSSRKYWDVSFKLMRSIRIRREHVQCVLTASYLFLLRHQQYLLVASTVAF